MHIIKILPLAALVAFSAAAPAQQGGRPFKVQLSGTAEVPGPGDPDGTGTASLRINPGKGQLCYTLTVAKIEPATAAHIHRGTSTEAGDVVVPLDAPASGSSKACATVTRELAQEIIRNPSAFYINVHNKPFPKGAVRGQIGR
jgi:hypothetical protein